MMMITLNNTYLLDAYTCSYFDDVEGIKKYGDDDYKRPEEITGQLVLKSSLVVNDGHAG